MYIGVFSKLNRRQVLRYVQEVHYLGRSLRKKDHSRKDKRLFVQSPKRLFFPSLCWRYIIWYLPNHGEDSTEQPNNDEYKCKDEPKAIRVHRLLLGPIIVD